MDRFTDLKFVIGVFFCLVGVTLLVYSLTKRSMDVNFWCGSVYVVFGLGMVLGKRSGEGSN